MSIPYFDVSEAIERVRVECDGMFRFVGGASDFAAAQGGMVAAPAVYLIVSERQVDTQPATGAFLHRCRMGIEAVVVTQNARSYEHGVAHQVSGFQLVDAVVAALNNWTPPLFAAEAKEAIRSQGRGRLLALSNEHWWWSEPFEFVYWGRTT